MADAKTTTSLDDSGIFRISDLPDDRLLRLWAVVMQELRTRKLVRSANNPVADLAESLVAGLYGVTPVGGVQAGYDVVTPDGVKIQVKGIRLTQKGRNTLSAIRSLDFDVLMIVVFARDLTVKEILGVPRAAAARFWKWNEHWNGYRLSVTQKLRNDSEVESMPLPRP